MRITTTLSTSEADALLRLAEHELRDPCDELRHIVRRELRRRGILRADEERQEVRDAQQR